MAKINFENLPNVVGIVGSRDFKNKKWVEHTVRSLNNETIVVSGGARGVDMFAREETIHTNHLYYKPFHVEDFEWNLLGKAVGHVRNYLLIQYVHWFNGIILLFVVEIEGKLTPGSTNVKETCERLGCPYIMINQEGEVIWSKNASFAIKQ